MFLTLLCCGKKERELGKVELPAVTEVAGLLLAVIPGKTSEERPAGASGGRHVAKPRAVGALPIDQSGAETGKRRESLTGPARGGFWAWRSVGSSLGSGEGPGLLRKQALVRSALDCSHRGAGEPDMAWQASPWHRGATTGAGKGAREGAGAGCVPETGPSVGWPSVSVAREGLRGVIFSDTQGAGWCV